jgi:hypothetical protein
MRWTLPVRRRCAPGRTVKPCGPVPSTLGSSLPRYDFGLTAETTRSASDGGYQARYPGESTEQPTRTIVQGMPDRSVTCGDYARVLVLFSHARLRAHRRLVFPAPCLRDTDIRKAPRAICAAGMRSHVFVIARTRIRRSPQGGGGSDEAIHGSASSQAGIWIASSASLLQNPGRIVCENEKLRRGSADGTT